MTTVTSVVTEFAMKHSSWARWCIRSSTTSSGTRSPHSIAGSSVTRVTANRPSALPSSTPTARSVYDSTTKRFRAAIARNVSMWHDDNAATNASSGFTSAGLPP